MLANSKRGTLVKQTWFTSDLHLFHSRMAQLRGFATQEEMHEIIIGNWNALVGKSDTVYILGDFGFKHPDLRKIRFRLNGKLHLIVGNHDRKNMIVLRSNLFSSIQDIAYIKYNKMPIMLCHYQMTVWDRSRYNAWHLFGHTHTGLNTPRMSTSNGKSFDVGLDNWHMRPISFEEVEKVMRNQPNNFNYRKPNDTKTL